VLWGGCRLLWSIFVGEWGLARKPNSSSRRGVGEPIPPAAQLVRCHRVPAKEASESLVTSKEGPSHCLRNLGTQTDGELGQEAFERILPRLRSAKMLGLKRYPASAAGSQRSRALSLLSPFFGRGHPGGPGSSICLAKSPRSQRLVRIEARRPLCCGDYRKVVTSLSGNSPRGTRL
jgi:hypothetical protein